MSYPVEEEHTDAVNAEMQAWKKTGDALSLEYNAKFVECCKEYKLSMYWVSKEYSDISTKHSDCKHYEESLREYNLTNYKHLMDMNRREFEEDVKRLTTEYEENMDKLSTMYKKE